MRWFFLCYTNLNLFTVLKKKIKNFETPQAISLILFYYEMTCILVFGLI